jgi:hypothetical protein
VHTPAGPWVVRRTASLKNGPKLQERDKPANPTDMRMSGGRGLMVGERVTVGSSTTLRTHQPISGELETLALFQMCLDILLLAPHRMQFLFRHQRQLIAKMR